MKEEASDFLELETIKNLVRKYSQFINFPIYVWSSKVRPTPSPAMGLIPLVAMLAVLASCYSKQVFNQDGH